MKYLLWVLTTLTVGQGPFGILEASDFSNLRNKGSSTKQF
ncbi:hypothetical protein EMELA_v1c06020 [Mesoplasma melaleucae]|uniref:Uncharacterized protein n=1 Tax=Mesoplasma melaleucae TaxID=81459 RepID=A0A2K8NWC4_9MOLU|nr:hypothetical protein EMELA_v1c06020 [Mesoplasma melaleucae]